MENVIIETVTCKNTQWDLIRHPSYMHNQSMIMDTVVRINTPRDSEFSPMG